MLHEKIRISEEYETVILGGLEYLIVRTNTTNEAFEE